MPTGKKETGRFRKGIYPIEQNSGTLQQLCGYSSACWKYLYKGGAGVGAKTIPFHGPA